MAYFSSYQDGANIFCDNTPTCEESTCPDRIVCSEFEIIQCGVPGDPNNPCGLAVVNNGLLLCDCDQTWNCGSCGNDLLFYNIINLGDDLIFQFQQIDSLNGQDPNVPPVFGWDPFGLVDAYIHDCCSGDLLLDGLGNPISLTMYSTEYFVGMFPVYDYKGDVTWRNIQQIRVNDLLNLQSDLLTQFPNSGGCFYLSFNFYPSDIGQTYSLCTEPYKFEQCTEKNDTILLEGSFGEFDCFGYYYGSNPDDLVVLGNFFPFVNQYRVKGSFEMQSFEIIKDFVGTTLKTTSSTMTEKWLMRTYHVPQRVAKIIANICNGSRVYVNSYEIVVDGDIAKNNEVGDQWWIDVPMRRVDCSKTYSCNY
jgi:hypothetical protein